MNTGYIDNEIGNIKQWSKIDDRKQAELFGFTVPKRIGFIATDIDRRILNDLMGERGKLQILINDIMAKHDKSTHEDRMAFMDEMRAFYNSQDGIRIKEIDIELFEKCSGIDYRFALSFENKEALYLQAQKKAQELSLDLNIEQQAILSGYTLPTRDGNGEDRPPVIHINFDGVEEYDRFRVCYEVFLENLDIQNYLTAAKLREWPLEPIRKAVMDRTADFYVIPLEEQAAINNQDFSIIGESLENTISTVPTTFITTIDKVSNKATVIAKKGELNIDVSKRGKGEPIRTLVKIKDMRDLDGVTIPQTINNFDREVMDAITTLNVIGGNQYVTESQVQQVLTGNKKARISPKQKEKISEAFTKLMYTQISIDATEEIKAYKYKTPKGWEGTTIDSPIINAKRVRHKINGTFTECIKLLDAPILYTYANMKNQIARVPIELLNSPINKNEESIVLQGYLIRQIEYMKGTGRRDPNILYSTIYEMLNIPYSETKSATGKDRKSQKDTRDKAKVILRSFKEKGFIKDYEEISKGNKAHSIKITV